MIKITGMIEQSGSEIESAKNESENDSDSASEPEKISNS